MKVLSGHYSQETAYVVNDYPYGFTLRCKIRYWLEVNKKGTRFMSQTTNPKITYAEVWNKPKASTYSIAGAIYMLDESDGKPDEVGHIHWAGLSAYDASKTRAFLTTYGEGLTPGEKSFCEKLAALYEKREAAEAAAKQ